MITPDGVETVLYRFGGLADGGQPTGSLVQSGGYLYGTANYGGTTTDGCGTYGCGVVFRVTPAGEETALHAFTGAPPNSIASSRNTISPSSLVKGRDGAFYGVTESGGASYLGSVFRITASGEFTTLYSFPTGINVGAGPYALIQGSDGDLYGLMSPGAEGGSVFRVSLSGTGTVFSTFNATRDSAPSDLIQGSDGNLYGTGGADSDGTLFKLTLAGAESILFSFPVSAVQAFNPTPNSLVQDGDGNFYGTSSCGGANHAGTVFKINPAGEEIGVYSFNGPPCYYGPALY